MSKGIKFTLVLFAGILGCFTLFYLYPAAIFESSISGSGGELILDLSLKSSLFGLDMPAELNTDNINSVRPTFQGGLIMFICIIGLPMMIAWRTVVKRPASSEEE